MEKKLTRREMLRLTGTVAAGSLLAACAAPAPQVVEKVVTQVVEKEKVVEKSVDKVVTATPPAKGPVTIVATNHLDLQAWEATAARIKEQLPNVTLQLVSTPWGGGWGAYADSVITRIAGGEQIDILAIGIELVPLMTSAKILRPLDDYLAGDKAAADDYANDIHPVLWQMPQVEGKQYGIPYAWNNMVIHYNKKVFQERGVDLPSKDWTWEDFANTCTKLSNVNDNENDVFGYHCDDIMFMLQPWYHSNETSPLSADWKDSNLTDPKIAETLTYLQEMIKSRAMISPQAQFDVWNQFVAGHLGMLSAGRWIVPFFGSQNFQDWDIALFPKNKGDIRSVVGTHQHGITTLAKAPDEAWIVLKEMTSAEQNISQMDFIGDIPARKSAAANERFTREGPGNVDLWYGSLDYAKTIPCPVNFNIVDPLLRRHYGSIWNGDKTVDQAVQEAHAELQKEMDALKG
jgi:multiple sugar transport system substrate-binding protein